VPKLIAAATLEPIMHVLRLTMKDRTALYDYLIVAEQSLLQMEEDGGRVTATQSNTSAASLLALVKRHLLKVADLKRQIGEC
jgi:hypothetical protein